MKELPQYPLDNIPVQMSRQPCFDETMRLLGSGNTRLSLEFIVSALISYGVASLQATGYVCPLLVTYSKQKKTAAGRLPWRSEIWNAAVREVLRKAGIRFYVIVADTEPETAQGPSILNPFRVPRREKIIAYACDRLGNQVMATRSFRREMVKVLLEDSLEYGLQRKPCPWKLPHNW